MKLIITPDATGKFSLVTARSIMQAWDDHERTCKGTPENPCVMSELIATLRARRFPTTYDKEFMAGYFTGVCTSVSATQHFIHDLSSIVLLMAESTFEQFLGESLACAVVCAEWVLDAHGEPWKGQEVKEFSHLCEINVDDDLPHQEKL